MRAMQYLTTLFIVIFLTACGGGGGGGSAKTKSAQAPLAFGKTEISIPIGDNASNTLSGGSGTGIITYASSDINIATVDAATGSIKALNAGSANITATKDGDTNYLSQTAQFALIVTKKNQAPLSIEANKIEKQIIDASFTNPVSGGNGSGAITYASDNTSVAQVDPVTGAITIVGSGTATITTTKAGDSQYSSSSTSFTLTVNKIDQQPLAFDNTNVTKAITDNDFNNAVSGGSGSGAITYSSSDAQIAEVNPTTGMIKIHKSGTLNIVATKESDAIYKSTSTQFSLTIVKLVQADINFSKPVVQKILGEPAFFNIISGGSGTGNTTYTSSDESVANVNKDTGEITLLTKGSVVITATKADDNIYLPKATSFTLNVELVVTQLLAEIGIDDTLISWGEQGGNLQIYRSSDKNCDTNNIASCADKNQSTITPSANHLVVDKFLNTNHAGYITVGNDKHLSQPISVQVPDATFGKRRGEELVAFKGKLFLIGGLNDENNKDTCLNDIWSTADGVTWKKEKSQAAFSARYDHRVTEFKDALWLFSGEECIGTGGASMFTGNMWKSYDGINWTNVSVSAKILGKRRHTLTQFNNKLWLIGGAWDDPSIWSSEDGATWTQVVDRAPFESRQGHSVAVFKNKLWLIGGIDFQSTSQSTLPIHNDIWSSADGINWVQENSNASFSPRTHHILLNFQGKLWMIGGYANNFSGIYNETWSSTDGINWTLESSPITPTGYWTLSSVVFNNKLWLHGTDTKVWSSDDGKTWRTPLLLSPSWLY